eukprot:1194661-Prorocentrum_minimum.AAC.5
MIQRDETAEAERASLSLFERGGGDQGTAGDPTGRDDETVEAERASLTLRSIFEQAGGDQGTARDPTGQDDETAEAERASLTLYLGLESLDSSELEEAKTAEAERVPPRGLGGG